MPGPLPRAPPARSPREEIFNTIISYILLASAIIVGVFEDWLELTAYQILRCGPSAKRKREHFSRLALDWRVVKYGTDLSRSYIPAALNDATAQHTAMQFKPVPFPYDTKY